jgi:hypothetical protein
MLWIAFHRVPAASWVAKFGIEKPSQKIPGFAENILCLARRKNDNFCFPSHVGVIIENLSFGTIFLNGSPRDLYPSREN